MTIRTILVDDEKLAIQGMELRLEAHADVEIVETCLNGREAIRAIKTHKPDLVFLDIQMPGFDGFSVVQGLMEVEPPLFVFVTAYADHAVRAFDAQATDYLMKPVDESRLAETLDRVRLRLAEKRGMEEAERLKDVLAEHAPEVHEEYGESDDDTLADNQCAFGLRQQRPATIGRCAEIQPFPFPAGTFTMTQQPGRQHTRVVDDQQVAGLQQLR